MPQATRIGPPWRYASLPGYEILSRCDDSVTDQYIRALLRGDSVMKLRLPQPPAMVETYRLIAKVWSHSAIKPTKEHLAVLDEGMMFFWSDKGLADDVNALRSQWGYPCKN
jgi:hypothetical protein